MATADQHRGAFSFSSQEAHYVALRCSLRPSSRPRRPSRLLHPYAALLAPEQNNDVADRCYAALASSVQRKINLAYGQPI